LWPFHSSVSITVEQAHAAQHHFNEYGHQSYERKRLFTDGLSLKKYEK